MTEPTITPAPVGGKLPEAAPPEADGARNVQVQPSEQPNVVVPKTFTEAEVNARIATIKGGHEGVVKKMRVDIETLTRERDEAQTVNRTLEYDNWLRALREEAGGEGLDLIKRVQALDQHVRTKAAELGTRKKSLDALQAELDEAGKAKFVYDTVRKYGLSEDYNDVLSTIDDKWEIEAKAASLALESARASSVPTVELDRGQGKPVKRDLSSMSVQERLGRAMAGEFD